MNILIARCMVALMLLIGSERTLRGGEEKRRHEEVQVGSRAPRGRICSFVSNFARALIFGSNHSQPRTHTDYREPYRDLLVQRGMCQDISNIIIQYLPPPVPRIPISYRQEHASSMFDYIQQDGTVVTIHFDNGQISDEHPSFSVQQFTKVAPQGIDICAWNQMRDEYARPQGYTHFKIFQNRNFSNSCYFFLLTKYDFTQVRIGSEEWEEALRTSHVWYTPHLLPNNRLLSTMLKQIPPLWKHTLRSSDAHSQMQRSKDALTAMLSSLRPGETIHLTEKVL